MIQTCGECGVPTLVASGLKWENNGVISLTGSPRNRMVFFESETIDRIFQGIELLIGIPIEHIILESRSRETKRFIEKAFPPDVRQIIDNKELSLESRISKMPLEERAELHNTMRYITQTIIDIGRMYGYGDQKPGELWALDADCPWRVQVVRNPYSLLFISADNIGAVEAFERTDMWVDYEDVGEGTYRVEVFPCDHPVGLRERLKRTRYQFKPGNISYDLCPSCGMPLLVSSRKWDLAEGTITDQETGRNMSIFGPFSMDSICDDLERELGDLVPATVIESTRRYAREAWSFDQWNRDGATFQQMLAVRGLGNLVYFDGDREHLDVVIENSCLHLVMVGTIQALVEMAYRVDSSTCEWELAKDGNLTISIKVNRN
ncbi:MAG: hypothetical protein JW738_10165 [Actinobacteria bacterium]|nr:hypothetical protein [Actinomycetota bacterium]